MALCAGCKQTLPRRHFLICSLCKEGYDLDCANVPEKRFFNTMTIEHRNKWKCQACICRMPKQNCPDTPVRPQASCNILNDDSELNITHRPKPGPSSRVAVADESFIIQDADEVTGDTQINETLNSNMSTPHEHPTEEMISLDRFSQLLDKKLENIKKSILKEVKETIQVELNIVIKKIQRDSTEISQKLTKEQEVIKEQVNIIDKKIKNIEYQLENLDVTKKKIVLYGLPEPHNENNFNLFENVNKVFGDILDLNANPYIEDIRRIGKRGKNRPLEIEFISKRFTKYILENSKYFKNTGLAVSQFITGDELRNRNALRQKLRDARQKGLFATIKNNTLYINGKPCEDYTLEAQNNNVPKNNQVNDQSLPPQQKKEETAEQNNCPFR